MELDQVAAAMRLFMNSAGSPSHYYAMLLAALVRLIKGSGNSVFAAEHLWSDQVRCSKLRFAQLAVYGKTSIWVLNHIGKLARSNSRCLTRFRSFPKSLSMIHLTTRESAVYAWNRFIPILVLCSSRRLWNRIKGLNFANDFSFFTPSHWSSWFDKHYSSNNACILQPPLRAISDLL
jgi:hypothetical protein